MKRRIRLSESQLRSVIKESVKNIIRESNYRSGFESHDGNGMVGGAWGGGDEDGYAYIDIEDLFYCYTNIDDVTLEKFMEYFKSKNNGSLEVEVEGTMEYGYDDSVGCPYHEDLEDVEEPTYAYDIINQCGFLSDEEKTECINLLKKKVDELEMDDFEFPEPDYDEPDYDDERDYNEPNYDDYGY